MAVHVEAEVLPLPLRWLTMPLVGFAMLTTLVAAARRRLTEPALPQMSDDWIRQYVANEPPPL